MGVMRLGFTCRPLIFSHSLTQTLEPAICVLGTILGAGSTVETGIDLLPTLSGTCLKNARSILKKSRHLHVPFTTDFFKCFKVH